MNLFVLVLRILNAGHVHGGLVRHNDAALVEPLVARHQHRVQHGFIEQSIAHPLRDDDIHLHTTGDQRLVHCGYLHALAPTRIATRNTPARNANKRDVSSRWMPTCAPRHQAQRRGDTASRARRGDEASTKRHHRYHKHSSNFSCPESHCARPPRGNQRLRQHKIRTPATQRTLHGSSRSSILA